MKATLLAAVAAGMVMVAGTASAQTVVLVRHAEKADASRDPVLSEAGLDRSVALLHSFMGIRPDLVLITPLQRTELTAGPTLDAFAMPEGEGGEWVRTISLESGIDAHIAAIITEIRSQPREALILVVGHSNTVPLIARALGVEADDMPECEYDRMTRIDLNGSAPTAVVTRYGAASTC